ncbi:hypothetical protein Tco_1483749, partial [Tanacetum coccineum]
MDYYLKGSGSILFCLILEYNEETKKTISALSLYKLDISSAKWDELEYLKDWDITNKTWDTLQDDASDLCTTSDMWEEMLEIKDSIFFMDPTRDYSVFYSPAIASDLGGLSGESVEVFKMNNSNKEWEKLDSLGRHMIYICGTTCLCIEAKYRHMENKIYFPQLHSKNKWICSTGLNLISRIEFEVQSKYIKSK